MNRIRITPTDITVLAAGFIVWASIIAARSVYTHPYELLWFVGNILSGVAAFILGRVWSTRPIFKPRVDDDEREGGDGRL